jgi:hypothetical protein
MTFPFSPIQVVEHTSDRLVVVDPPNMLMGLGALFAAALMSFFVLKYGKPDNPNEPARWGLVLGVFAGPIVLLALVLLTARTTATFSRPEGTFTLQKTWLGVPVSTRRLPLKAVKSASVTEYAETRRLMFVTESGEALPLGLSSDRKGHYEAAEAINMFLAGVTPGVGR